jgi:hypothetical protein
MQGTEYIMPPQQPKSSILGRVLIFFIFLSIIFLVVAYFMGWLQPVIDRITKTTTEEEPSRTPLQNPNNIPPVITPPNNTDAQAATTMPTSITQPEDTTNNAPTPPPSNTQPATTTPSNTQPEVDCSDASYDTFCRDPVYQLRNCKNRRSPITTDQQDLAAVTDCGIRNKISAENYTRAQQYFTEKGLSLSGLPDTDCMNSTYDNFCENPASQLKYCKSIRSPPTSDQDDLKSVTDCGIRNKTSAEQYLRAQQYFTEKGLTLPDKPDVDCMDATFDNFCKNPTSQLKYCKSIRSPVTTDQQDLASVTDCGLRNLTPAAEYTKAQQYFTQKGLTLPDRPDVDCLNATYDYFCQNPVSQLKYCKPLKSPITSDQQDFESVRDCGLRNKTPADQYTRAQQYFKEKGFTLPDRPDVDCLNGTFDYYCKNPVSQIRYCKPLRSPQSTDQQDFTSVKDCMTRKLIPQDQYQRAKDYFATKGLTLPEFVTIDCNSCPQYSFFCNNLNNCMKCKEAASEAGPGTNRPSDASINAALGCATYYPAAKADYPILAQRYPQFVGK